MDQVDKIFSDSPVKIVLSKPRKSDYKKIVISQKENGYHIEMFTDKRAFHKNARLDDVRDFCENAVQGEFSQLNAWDKNFEHILLISKKGKISYKRKANTNVTDISPHNRQKQYILSEGLPIPPLVDMGILTHDGKVINSMYDKFRQINRFVEIIDDAVKKSSAKHLNIIDFGCGKSYLTFILYYYFTEIKKIDVNMTGLDLKADVIKNCNETARRYGYDRLHFELGDINGYKTNDKTDMVITLHACDTATDYALYNAIQLGANMIFSVPCCQHELNKQIKSDTFSILTRYGIIKERAAALMTDAIRGNLLEASGYKTQLLEFIDMEHTPKNILIRAVKQPVPNSVKNDRLNEVKRIIEEFNLEPTLYYLLESYLTNA